MLDDPVYKAQFLSFLNETSNTTPQLKSALGIDITKRDRELFEPNQVMRVKKKLIAFLFMLEHHHSNSKNSSNTARRSERRAQYGP